MEQLGLTEAYHRNPLLSQVPIFLLEDVHPASATSYRGREQGKLALCSSTRPSQFLRFRRRTSHLSKLVENIDEEAKGNAGTWPTL
jgi:hypothetical protein